ncbi:SDR family NAD(P)-dependent oxidoreductase [Leucobacter albus]|uniref:SDR family NAD(P)-dependent oxidoreductase n=1 Tax=Leucobacter albus TaxID=272210 RepID=A0ABW3TKX4_9MICO
MNDLEGKIAMVVGAGTAGDEIGNGRATALLMARHGATVVCVDRDADSARRTAEMIVAEGGTAEGLGADATDEAAVAALVADVVQRYGRIDVLDNNVGIGKLGGVTELADEEWNRVIAVNLKTAINAMKHVIPHMVAAGGGAIVNISSVAGLRWGGAAYASYYATKAALTHLSRTTAIEFARAGVRVNAISPGYIKTPMVASIAGLSATYGAADVAQMWEERDRQVPLGHMGEPWDVAEAAVFLASDRAKFITGTDLVVDGGLTVKSAG